VTESPRRPARGAIELHCVLEAIGSGATAPELAARLGIHPTLAPSLHRMVAERLAGTGYVTDADDRLALTALGDRVHRDALEGWGVG